MTEYAWHEQKVMPNRAFCKGCNEIFDYWYPKPIEIEMQNVERAVSLSCGGRYKVLHHDIWRQVAHLCPTVVFGKVSVWKGEFLHPTHEWVAPMFPPSEMVHVRGSYTPDQSITGGISHHVCTKCNRQLFYASHDRHLVRCQIPDGRPVFMDRLNDLIIAEPIAQQMDWSGFPDFVYDRLPVRDRPLDGMRLLGDPDWSAMDTG